MSIKMTEKLLLVLQVISWMTPVSFSYCTWAGANPYWTGAPTVEQLTLTSVRVSWAGLLERSDCADSMIVKWFKGDNTNDFSMSDPLTVETNSFIVKDVVPRQLYTYQVIAREEKGWMGVDYDRSPKTRFTTRNSNKVIEKDDPLHVPTSSSSEHNDDNENISSDDEEIIKPVYTPEVKKSNSNFLNSEIKDDDVLGMKLEMFIGIVMGSLIVVIVAVGIVYNCFKKKGGEKDIELEFESESEDGESSDEEDDGGAFVDEAKGVKKYEMMLTTSGKVDEPATAPELQHSLSSP